MQATDIAHVIQLAVAPVFLLTGIGALRQSSAPAWRTGPSASVPPVRYSSAR